MTKEQEQKLKDIEEELMGALMTIGSGNYKWIAQVIMKAIETRLEL